MSDVSSRDDRLPPPRDWCAGGYLGTGSAGPRSDMAHGGWARKGQPGSAAKISCDIGAATVERRKKRPREN